MSNSETNDVLKTDLNKRPGVWPTALEKLEAVLRGLLALLMAALVVSVSWQVLSRYLLSQPSAWTEEAARFLLIWIGVLGATYAYRQRLHLAIDLLPKKLGPVAGARLERLNALLVAVFALTAMVIGGGRLVWITWALKQISPALGLPMAVVYGVVPLSGFLLLMFSLLRMKESGLEAGSKPVEPETGADIASTGAGNEGLGTTSESQAREGFGAQSK